MDARKFDSIISRQVAGQFGLNVTQVQKIIRQYHDAIMKIVEKMDLKNIDPNEIPNMKIRAIYVPGLGKFIVNRGYIEKWQNKYKNKKENVED